MSVGRVSGLVRNVRAAQPSPEPGLCKAQVVTDDVYGPAKSLGGFLRGHAAEILHLNDAGERLILLTERFENAI